MVFFDCMVARNCVPRNMVCLKEFHSQQNEFGKWPHDGALVKLVASLPWESPTEGQHQDYICMCKRKTEQNVRSASRRWSPCERGNRTEYRMGIRITSEKGTEDGFLCM